MQETIKEKLNNIIRIPEKTTDPKAILDLDVRYFRGVDARLARTLNAILNIQKIKDFIDVRIDENKFLTLKVLGIDPTELNLWIFVARMLNEDKIDLFFGPKKISILGLDNSGKTSILRILQNKLNIDIFGKMAPTIGADRTFIDKLKYGMTYNVLDMGGQEEYRKDYIRNAEKYFIGVEYLMYVIDIQDPANYEKAINYFQEIIGILVLLKENPEILIVLNKVDPDIKDDSEIQNSCYFLENQINQILLNKGFNYEITQYSIYNTLGTSKALIKGIRDLLTGRTAKEISESTMGSSLEHVLNIIINLASEIETRFIELEKSHQYIFEWIDYLRKSIPEPKKSDSLAYFKKVTLQKEKDILKNTLQKELKSILKMRESD
ncbi:MAG: ADP-ribosylation factor-like protein [Candidatus Helarchaeota archaeon]